VRGRFEAALCTVSIEGIGRKKLDIQNKFPRCPSFGLSSCSAPRFGCGRLGEWELVPRGAWIDVVID